MPDLHIVDKRDESTWPPEGPILRLVVPCPYRHTKTLFGTIEWEDGKWMVEDLWRSWHRVDTLLMWSHWDPDEKPEQNTYMPNPMKQQLSPREREAWDHIAEGISRGEIAERMEVSPRTVDTYMQRILDKTGIKSRDALRVEAGYWRGVQQ